MTDSDLRAALAETPPLSPAPVLPPPPKPPQPPVEGECCERGCERCVWVYYHEAMRRYEAAVAE
ncbi:MAG: oxidoreductase-like domain-containing protein [Candidatus Contendobacter sp.]|nr:oxidoreductase-like domain-containing protein [Candidatus Contendobacter sp.]